MSPNSSPLRQLGGSDVQDLLLLGTDPQDPVDVLTCDLNVNMKMSHRRWLLKDLVTSPMPTAQPTLPARARPIPSLPLSIKQQQPQPKPLLVTSSLSLTRKQSQQQKLLPRTSHWNAPARVSSKRPAASRSRRVASSSSSSFQKSLSCVSIIQPSSSSAFSSPYSNDSDDDSSSSGSRIAMDESGLFALPRPVKSRRMNGDERLLLAAATANTEAALRACSGVSASSDAVPGQLDDLLSRVPHFTGKDNIKRISPETLAKVLDGSISLSSTSSAADPGSGRPSNLRIIDCRYDYEFAGGHLAGATNVSTPSDLEALLFPRPLSSSSAAMGEHRDETASVLVVLHCEFSQHRAPKMARHLRNHDRHVNAAVYPRLNYPNVCLLDGGYAAYHCLVQEQRRGHQAEAPDTPNADGGGSLLATITGGYTRMRDPACKDLLRTAMAREAGEKSRKTAGKLRRWHSESVLSSSSTAAAGERLGVKKFPTL
ncbi:MAG: hypothetical protein SGCHY_002126 [Lobulomycetales sp.]